MQNCGKCGDELTDNAKFCPNCGTKLDSSVAEKNEETTQKKIEVVSRDANYYLNTYKPSGNLTFTNNNYKNENDKKSLVFFILSMFLPFVGVILWYIWKDSYPEKAASCSTGTLIGFVLYLIILSCVATVWLFTPNKPPNNIDEICTLLIRSLL